MGKEKHNDNDNVLNVSENNDNDNVEIRNIKLSDSQIAYYDEFLACGFRDYSNIGFLNLACYKLQRFMYRWQVELNEEERRYLANRLSYKDYLASPYWQFVSSVYKCRANFECNRCGQKRMGRLSLHHKSYDHIGSELQYPEDMEVLCAQCHMKEHGRGAYDNEE